jgi:hypothetical protein
LRGLTAVEMRGQLSFKIHEIRLHVKWCRTATRLEVAVCLCNLVNDVLDGAVGIARVNARKVGQLLGCA